MVLPVGRVGDNPFQPGASSETYIPDQLIAGDLKLVTDNLAVLASGTLYQRGTVVGQILEQAAAGVAGTQASGTFTFDAIPAPNDTITLQGTVVTFIANDTYAGANQVAVGLDIPSTIEALENFLNASTDANIDQMTYSGLGDVLTATAVLGGAGGNALTIAAASAAIAVSGATLAGGAANTGNGTMNAPTIQAGAKIGNYKIKMTAATTFTVTNPDGIALANGTTGVAYTDEIGFTITVGGVAFINGDTFSVAVSLVGQGVYKLSQANAVDGSQIPAGVVVDQYDATGGNARGAVYLMGEFNAGSLIYDPSWTIPTLMAAFRKSGIFIKTAVSALDPLENN